MIKVSIMYPYSKDRHFDIRFYSEVHMPMSIDLMKDRPGYRGVIVESGLNGVEPGSDPEYVAICNYLFDSVQQFWDAALPHGEMLQKDMAECTDIVPIIQISDVLIHG